jgi:hypothetical protein
MIEFRIFEYLVGFRPDKFVKRERFSNGITFKTRLIEFEPSLDMMSPQKRSYSILKKNGRHNCDSRNDESDKE